MSLLPPKEQEQEIFRLFCESRNGLLKSVRWAENLLRERAENLDPRPEWIERFLKEEGRSVSGYKHPELHRLERILSQCLEDLDEILFLPSANKALKAMEDVREKVEKALNCSPLLPDALGDPRA